MMRASQPTEQATHARQTRPPVGVTGRDSPPSDDAMGDCTHTALCCCSPDPTCLAVTFPAGSLTVYPATTGRHEATWGLSGSSTHPTTTLPSGVTRASMAGLCTPQGTGGYSAWGADTETLQVPAATSASLAQPPAFCRESVLTAVAPFRDRPWELPGLEEATLPLPVDWALELRPRMLPVLGLAKDPEEDPLDSRVGWLARAPLHAAHGARPHQRARSCSGRDACYGHVARANNSV